MGDDLNGQVKYLNLRMGLDVAWVKNKLAELLEVQYKSLSLHIGETDKMLIDPMTLVDYPEISPEAPVEVKVVIKAI